MKENNNYMNKGFFINYLYSRYPSLGRRFLEEVTALFFTEVEKALKANLRVELRGFGTFCLRNRLSRSTKSLSKVALPVVRSIPFFRAGVKLKQLLNKAMCITPEVSTRRIAARRAPTFTLKTPRGDVSLLQESGTSA